jgi:tetratricopeptide (TPR) repeat protein
VAATHNRALAWARRGETAFAEAVLDRNSSLVSDSAPLLFLRGYLALLAGDLYSAQDSMEAARSRNESLPRVEFTLGLIYEHTGQHDLALDSTRRALLMSPLYLPQVWLLDHGLGGSLVELAASGGTEEHAAYTDTVLLSLGRSLLDAGHLGESLAVFDQVLLRDEDHTGALFHRGVVLAKLRRYDEAMEDWAAVQHGGEESPIAVESARHSRSALRLAALFSGS